jgi:hypothetical protein
LRGEILGLRQRAVRAVDQDEDAYTTRWTPSSRDARRTLSTPVTFDALLVNGS